MNRQDAEQALQASGTDRTVLRCSFFSQNFSGNFFLDPILAAELALPVDGVPEPFIDVEDIADAALIQPGHSGQIYELAGPRAVRFAEATTEIVHTTKREIRYIPITPEQYHAALVEAQVPGAVSEVLYLFATVLDGRNTPVADGVQRALGCPPRDFAECAKRTAATGVWGL